MQGEVCLFFFLNIFKYPSRIIRIIFLFFFRLHLTWPKKELLKGIDYVEECETIVELIEVYFLEHFFFFFEFFSDDKILVGGIKSEYQTCKKMIPILKMTLFWNGREEIRIQKTEKQNKKYLLKNYSSKNFISVKQFVFFTFHQVSQGFFAGWWGESHFLFLVKWTKKKKNHTREN